MSRVRWLALLPASKGVTDRVGVPDFGALATGPRRELLDALGDADDSDDPTPLSARPTTPTWRRYDGVVHRAADPGSLSDADRRRWHRHVAYVSALGGLLASTDRIPAYRLEMARVVDGLGGLGPWWRPHITDELSDRLAPGALLWLLTGAEYARAVEAPDGVHVIEPRFLRDDGERSMPSATVKQARGQLARALVEHPDLARRPTDPSWSEIELVCAGSPVRFDGAEDDGTPRWRTAG